ncbi:MAG: MATE family efflux transporter [Pseudomonadales bacterium]|nr:MATE family efflux transporter [Pseudomonadales bacterium]NRA14559.1 MATE family efflux transporter [Oceanospirillaceae bacterium]
MKHLAKFAVPLIISQLVAQLMVLSDIWMMARIGVTTMAAGGLAGSVFGFIFVVVMSLIGSVTNLLAIAHGEKQHNPDNTGEIRGILKGAILLSVLISIALLPLFYLLPTLLLMMGQPAEIVATSMLYLHALKWSMLPNLLIVVFRGLAVAFGSPRSVLWASVFTVLLNIVFSYVFAFVLDYGIVGIGYGTSLAAWVMAVCYGVWLFRQPKFLQYRPWAKWFEYKLSTIKPLLLIGISVALATMTEFGLISGAALMAGTLGVVSLAAHQIALQILSFSWCISYGFAQATSILVSNQYGSARDKQAIVNVARHGLILATASSVVIGLMFSINPEWLSQWFARPGDALFAELVDILPSLMLVAAACFVVDAWQLTGLNILRGMKIVFAPALITGVGYLLAGLPAAWYFMQTFHLQGIWMGIGLGLGVTGCLLMVQVSINLKKLAN